MSVADANEGGAMAVARDDESPAGRKRVIPLAAWLALAVVIIAVIVLLVLDLWMFRTPAQRDFIARNIECLRCHTDLIPRLDEASVHQPFLATHCTSCHSPHGYERRPVFRTGQMGPDWLRVRLEQLGLRFVWNGLTALSGERDDRTTEETGTVAVTGGPSMLKTSSEELCWTCHGNLSPEMLMTFRHPPFVEGKCTSCHDPHASMEPTLLRGKVEDVCVSCHRIYPELLLSDIHLPFGQRKCVTCHEPHASDHGGLLVAGQRDLCFSCHTETQKQLGKPVLHDPFVTGQCTGCHRPHSASFLPLLGAPQPELCYRCHPGVRGQFSYASRHPVPSRILCSDCHHPHAAPEQALLPMAQRQLCFSCHPSVLADLTEPVVHEAFEKGRCTRCHVPHGSPDAPLLVDSDPQLCRRCHPGIPSKPVRVAKPKAKPEPAAPRLDTVNKWPEESGVRPAGVPDPMVSPRSATSLMKSSSHRVKKCGQCHRGHSSAYQRLLVQPGDILCLRCHTASVSQMSSSAHNGISCARCHTPHNAPALHLLTRKNERVCTSCHKGFTDKGSDHPVGTRYYDYLAKDPLSCASTCHNPHGSTHVRMLRVPYGTRSRGTDYICLICHTKVGVQY